VECPVCGGATRIVAFSEEQRVVLVILEHSSLRSEQRPTPPAEPRAPLELEYLSWLV
jgi:hypothetical protein